MARGVGGVTPWHADHLTIGAFVNALFRYAESGTYISLRAFDQIDARAPPRILAVRVNGSLDKVVMDATVAAEEAAQADRAQVFCPPICTFTNSGHARLRDLANGLVLTVEVDEGDPDGIRARLEAILGPATVVVASGSDWIDPVTGAIKARIHLHWRLNEPTTTEADHERLRQARRLACLLVGADPTANAVVHPLRWPGSWNLKRAATGQARMATIAQLNDDAEIDLGDALTRLEEAVEAAGLAAKASIDAVTGGASSTPEAALADISSALLAIPNGDRGAPDEVGYAEWVRLGIATRRATGGGADGFNLWDAWSRLSNKYDARETIGTWRRIVASTATPGTGATVGAGTIFFLAGLAGWVRPFPFANAGSGAAPGAAPGLTATPVEELDLDIIPARRWVYGRELIRGYVSVLASVGGVGKTAYAMLVGVCVALGLPLLGVPVHGRGVAWLFNLEDPLEEMRRRMAALLRHHKIAQADLAGRLYMDSGRDQPLVVTIRGRDGTLYMAPIVSALVAEIKRRGVTLFVADPMVHSHGASENNNEEMAFVMHLWARVAHEAGCAVWLPHHFRKGGQGGDADAIRGAGAIQGAARAMHTLSAMSEEEAQRVGVKAEDRKSYIRHDSVKQNMARPPAAADWYRLVSVNLGNGNLTYPEGDEVQTVEMWTPPSPWDGLSWEMIEQILTRLDRGTIMGERYGFDHRAGDRWAGHAVMAFHKTAGEGQATAILKRWGEAGLLTVVKWMNPKTRKEVDAVAVDQAVFSEMRGRFPTPFDANVET
jgi:hypothetical protein